MKTYFHLIPHGTQFTLEKTPTHGSTTLEKIKPTPYITHQGFELDNVNYNAKWVDGPYSGTLCILPPSTDKAPVRVTRK